VQVRHHASTAKAGADLRHAAQATFLCACVLPERDMGLEAQVRRFPSQTQGEEHMNTYEDDEFQRIEREMKWRQMLIDNPPVAIPLITEEEWQALNAEKE
tara:strand:+ start:850 stop:1149 length:300 start_codon:yes stop_codon:yes gene_type:complete